ncbi:MAG: alpha/beta hydrolase [bacterium]|nr:alpha/beta hydrolase [Gammaproteobacteria bacterium]
MIKKVALGLVGIMLLLTLSGYIYQSIRNQQDLSKYPAPGEFYEIEGVKLHVDCRGTGSPVVVLEAGLTTGSLSWALVHDEIAEHTKVCAYDRPGIDWSEPIGRIADAREIGHRLNQLLGAAGITDDIVIVGMSAGGVYVREFYKNFPGQIVGMVLVDSSHEQQGFRLPGGDDDSSIQLVLEACRFLQPTGLIRVLRLLDGFVDDIMPDSVSKDFVSGFKAALNRSHSCSAIYWEMESFGIEVNDENLPASLGDLPLTVLSQGNEVDEAGQEQRDVWNLLQLELAALSTRGQRFVAENSGHVIQFEQPQLVIDKIVLMVKSFQTD